MVVHDADNGDRHEAPTPACGDELLHLIDDPRRNAVAIENIFKQHQAMDGSVMDGSVATVPPQQSPSVRYQHGIATKESLW